uniref:Oxysterol binding protein-like 1A n=1 Tax=Labrus bergylta TaxID=56723 RepID=A0A3Q3MTN2_9LABR
MEADSVEDQLLLFAKEGSSELSKSLSLFPLFFLSLTVAKSKTSSGWTALHLACYFGHRDVVEELLKVRAADDIHIILINKICEIVLLLLRYDACSNIINGTAQIPKDVTEDDEIITMLEAAERRERRRQEEKLLEAAREGDISTLSKLLSGKEAPDIHCRDSVGNTPLHCAAYRGQKQCAIKLLKCGASPSLKNQNGISPNVLDGLLSRSKNVLNAVQRTEGLLWKSSRFLGWRSHWVVIEDGTLSWYPRQADVLTGVRKQGCKSLTQSYCMIKPWDHCFFTLKCFDDTLHCFKVPSKTDSVATRKVRGDSPSLLLPCQNLA